MAAGHGGGLAWLGMTGVAGIGVLALVLFGKDVGEQVVAVLGAVVAALGMACSIPERHTVGTPHHHGFLSRDEYLVGTPDHREAVLADHERAADDCALPCVSRSRSDRLVLGR
ncbi:hypothetical protein GCM10017589_24270 [Streptomyces poonensis]|nr:hypothetical protein GCM10017589_24270 [Streptomyces poonensis]